MKCHLAAFAAASALVLGACGDATGPGSASEEDRADILAILDESGWLVDDFGSEGAVEDFSVSSGFDLGLSAAPADTVSLVRLWGRRHGRPVSRERNVLVEGDTAIVTFTVAFDGTFVIDRTQDGRRNPTSKPLHEQAVQLAVLVRRAPADSGGRRWRLVGITPQEWVMTDAAKQTVELTSVEIAVNGMAQLVIEDPAALLDIDTRLPRLDVGDVVRVAAAVANTTGRDNVPRTFVFLHLFHASPNARVWIRVPMVENDAGEFVREWTVRFPGRERIVVDAIDSQAFNTDDGDDYRANMVAIPYRIGRDNETG